jgi:hypothetical protein
MIMINSLNEEITRVAYELYEKSDRKEGNDLLNWLAAEKIVNFRKKLFPDRGEAVALLEYKPIYGQQTARPALRKPRSRLRKGAYSEQAGKGM